MLTNKDRKHSKFDIILEIKGDRYLVASGAKPHFRTFITPLHVPFPLPCCVFVQSNLKPHKPRFYVFNPPRGRFV